MKLGPYLLGPNDTPENGIYTGDAKELAKLIPDESVDLIFTDPPYPREFLPLYSLLSGIAVNVLKPGGLCFAYAGNDYLPDVMQRLAKKLAYRCTIAIEHAPSQILWHSRFIAR